MKKFFAYILGACTAFILKVSTAAAASGGFIRLSDGSPIIGAAYGMDPDNPLMDGNVSIWGKALFVITRPVVYVSLILLALIIGLVIFLVKRAKRKNAQKNS